ASGGRDRRDLRRHRRARRREIRNDGFDRRTLSGHRWSERREGGRGRTEKSQDGSTRDVVVRHGAGESRRRRQVGTRSGVTGRGRRVKRRVRRDRRETWEMTEVARQIKPYMLFGSMIGWRYLRVRRKEGVTDVITGFHILGI